MMDIKVTAINESGRLEWTIDGKKPKDSVIKLGKKTGSHRLDFKFADRTDLGLRFNRDDPIWIDENEVGECPSPGVSTDQIRVESCTDKRLSLFNSNSGESRTLHYRLNFVVEQGNHADDDPVI